jgi:hypothetical protein
VPQASVFVRALAWTAQRSYVLTQLNRTFELMARRLGPPAGAPQNGTAAPPAAARAFPRTRGQAITVRLIREFSAAVHAAGSRFVVVVTEGQGRAARELAQAVGDPLISYVYLDDAFRADDYARTHLPGDFHWNAAGHAIVAQTLARSLTDAKAVPADACALDAVRP